MTFLTTVLKEIILKNKNLKQLKFILPNKKSCFYLAKAIQDNLGENKINEPTIISIKGFIKKISILKEVNIFYQNFILYKIYLNLNKEKKQQDFYTFLQWSATLLNDFNTIDISLCPPESIFKEILNYKNVNSFGNKNNNSFENINFWKIISCYYEDFQKELKAKNLGNYGMLLKNTIENLDTYLEKTDKTHIFIGLNILNNAEEVIVQKILEKDDNADIYWDIDEIFFKKKNYNASYFIQSYLKKWDYFKNKKYTYFSNDFVSEKDIQIIGASKDIEQIKHVGKIIKNLQKENRNLSKTAIVLGKKELVNILLPALPNDIAISDISIGYKLKNTLVNIFFNLIFSLHEKKTDNNEFYFNILLELSSIPWLDKILLEQDGIDLKKILYKMKEKNNILISSKLLYTYKKNTSISELLFSPIKNIYSFINRCLKIIEYFISFLKNINNDSAILYISYYESFYKLFLKLQEYQIEFSSIENIQSLKYLYKDLLQQKTIKYNNAEKEGLQIMGLFESTLLDFENIIITNVNEEIIPKGKDYEYSFIPYPIKKQTEMHFDNDAIYSYHFYRLIQRPKRIFLLYNTITEGINKGEKSRFLYHLELLPETNKHRIIYPSIKKPILNKPKEKPIIVKKNVDIINKIKEISQKGLSPSSLTTYLKNPLDFYYKKILEIKEKEDLEYTMSHFTRGNLLHNTLEDIYKNYTNKILVIDDFKKMQNEVNITLEKNYKKIYKTSSKKIGLDYLYYEIIKKNIFDFIAIEKKQIQKGAKIKILEIEKEFSQTITIPKLPTPIKLIGKIDRIDTFNDTYRVIDYKIGMVSANDLKLKNWDIFNTENFDYKYSPIFQVLLYAYVQRELIKKHSQFQAGIIAFRNIKSYFIPFEWKENKAEQTIFFNKNLFIEFEKVLFNIIQEIFDPKVNFESLEQNIISK